MVILLVYRWCTDRHARWRSWE